MNMDQQKNGKRRIILMAAVLLMLILTIILWSVQMYAMGEATLQNVALQVLILTLLVVFMVPFFKSSWNSVKQGLPIDDERSRKVKVYAGYYAYIISIYAWLAIMFFEDYFDVGSACAAAILVSAVSFGAAYVIMDRRKKLD